MYAPIVVLRASYRQLLLLAAMFVVGGAIFAYYDGLKPVPALLASVSTITTIGLYSPNGGNLHSINQTEALLLIFMIVISVGSAVSLLQAVAGTILNGDQAKIKAGERIIGRLKGHLIVFGYGRIGQYVVHQLRRFELDFVVVTTDPQHYADLLKSDTLAVLEHPGKPMDALQQAGMDRAAMLVVSHENDPENMMITLSARRLRPDIRIVSVVHDADLVDAAKSAGADTVIPSSITVGHFLALAAITRNLVGFVVSEELGEREIVRFMASKSSGLIGKGLQEISEYGTVISIVRGGAAVGNLFDPGLRITDGDTLLVLADHENLAVLESRYRPKPPS